jgi:hypothetical protein
VAHFTELSHNSLSVTENIKEDCYSRQRPSDKVRRVMKPVAGTRSALSQHMFQFRNGTLHGSYKAGSKGNTNNLVHMARKQEQHTQPSTNQPEARATQTTWYIWSGSNSNTHNQAQISRKQEQHKQLGTNCPEARATHTTRHKWSGSNSNTHNQAQISRKQEQHKQLGTNCPEATAAHTTRHKSAGSKGNTQPGTNCPEARATHN